MENIRLKTLNSVTKIYIGRGLLDQTGSLISEQIRGRNAVIVSDSNAWPLYGERVSESLKSAGFTVSIALFEAGEESKQYKTLLHLYDEFHRADLTRAAVVVALGGGVVGDVAGFAASTYLRGIPIIQIPTTLLAQVDSSIGGKTAIDMPFGKNTVGAFHQPLLVVSDVDVLDTLPEKFFSDGMAEVIKYGCIKDKEMFYMCGNPSDKKVELINRCAQIKVNVVESDEFDRGERMLLNFGHTVGHAIEKCQNFKGMTHGEAVGVGMLAAAAMGEKLGITLAGTRKEIEKMLKINNLPITTDVNVKDICKALVADKKREESILQFIFLKSIGDSVIVSLPVSEICGLLEEVWI